MSEKPRFVGAIIDGWLKENGSINDDAAALLGASVSTYKLWKKNSEPLSDKMLPGFLSGLGARSLLEATIRYDATADFVSVYGDLVKESQQVLLMNFAGATNVLEARVMLPAYPMLSMNYRSELNAEVYEKLLSQKITMKKVEQLTNVRRIVELVHNVQTFSVTSYQLRVIENTRWIPTPSFSIFDERSVVLGGFHDKGIPTEEPFMNLVGKKYAQFYAAVWTSIWNTADEFGSRGDIIENAFDYVKKLPGTESMTINKLKEMVEERSSLARDMPTRY